MHYRIVATLGPSSDCPAVWSAMLTAGIDAFRLNTSHLTHESLSVWLEKLDPFLRPLQPRPPLILDLQGSKWRLGQFEPFELMPGDRIDLIAAENCTRIATLPIPHPDFFLAAPHSSERIALNDARSILVVEAIESNAIRTRVMRGGLVLPRKGITFIESDYRQE
ncbi:hypothetical protein JW992_05340, partial [candidate division KSB1 bacterium]|nr:hypothetical protein [candidate division KSB1 bacterium]